MSQWTLVTDSSPIVNETSNSMHIVLGNANTPIKHTEVHPHQVITRDQLAAINADRWLRLPSTADVLNPQTATVTAG